MDDLDPLHLDHTLAAAAGAARRWARRLRTGNGLDEDPLVPHRPALGQQALASVEALPVSDPLRPCLHRWVYRLTEIHASRAACSAVVKELRLQPVDVNEPERCRITRAELLKRALFDPARREGWLDAYLRSAPALGERVAAHWERRAELAVRLGLSDLDGLELPGTEVPVEAESWLAASGRLAEAARAPSLAAWIDQALGSDATRGWPAQLTLRSLADLLRETDILASLRLDPGPMPRAVASSSFLRGLRRLGAAWSDAAAATNRPFSVARDPYGLARRATGALFAALPTQRSFARRALGIGSPYIADHMRIMARVILMESRTAALRVVLRPAALQGMSAFREAFADRVAQALGFRLPHAVAGTVFRLDVDDAQRFAGILMAAERMHELTETHDDDWYRNPRAAEQLRAEAALSPEVSIDAVTLKRGARRLARDLEAALG